jgi:hypothetical protein
MLYRDLEVGMVSRVVADLRVGYRWATGSMPWMCRPVLLVMVKCDGDICLCGVIPQLPTILAGCGVVIRLAGAACARPRTGLLLMVSAQVD